MTAAIAILIMSSRGDVQPFVALGVRLMRAGFAVKFVAGAGFADLVEGNGLTYVPLDADLGELART